MLIPVPAVAASRSCAVPNRLFVTDPEQVKLAMDSIEPVSAHVLLCSQAQVQSALPRTSATPSAPTPAMCTATASVARCARFKKRACLRFCRT